MTPTFGVEYNVALGKEFIFVVQRDAARVAAISWKGRGELNWTSSHVSKLNVSQSVLSTEMGVSDRVYFLNGQDGRVYCFDANKRNVSSPAWRSNLVCSSNDQKQRMVGFCLLHTG